MKAFRTELHPTTAQQAALTRAFGSARWAYNEFLAFNYARYQHHRDGYGAYGYCNAYAFSVRFSLAKLLCKRAEGKPVKPTMAQTQLLDELLVGSGSPAMDIARMVPDVARLLLDTLTQAAQLPHYEPWVVAAHSKSIKQAFMHADKAYGKFFENRKNPAYLKRLAKRGKEPPEHPRFKKRGKTKDSIYLVERVEVERHRIKLPGLGWVRLKEHGYIPVGKHTISSMTVSRVAGRCYVSCIPKQSQHPTRNTANMNPSEGIGIDLGIKNLAIASDGRVVENINHAKEIRRLNKKLKRQQRALSRKLKAITHRTYYTEGPKKGQVKHVTYTRPLRECKNIIKNQRDIERTWQRIVSIRHDHMDKTIHELVSQEPRFITIEHLNIVNMMANRHLARALSAQELGRFVTRLAAACEEHGIELRQVSPWYPSSQLCSQCGYRNHAVRNLNIRAWDCPRCGTHHDRDMNAARNLARAEHYTIIA
ncbi:RNA-guided endonuclease InsQ/TnpB family protein [Bifidobacterium gallicum]|uniref:Transposase, IS605 OrfB family n=1 Tax=Bifidobacterium gallicum DSM 20093 = LMG 11596 TaxID=561180 RepID=D1NSR1_9BIFI|nr:RNA-guided endonuclease TnpB family protein [Bifidobacterium gallicum]EFA23713.1 transposase, IS605 OrfB family [Bifidobacterium gallicum DSM 20093 = LMG 11596]